MSQPISIVHHSHLAIIKQIDHGPVLRLNRTGIPATLFHPNTLVNLLLVPIKLVSFAYYRSQLEAFIQ